MSVYQRFLQSVVSKDLKLKNLNLRNFLTNEDKEILKTLSKLERTNFLNNFRLSLNNHIRNSYWFARLLSKISREKFLINSNKFSKKNNDPRNMKISLYKYSFNRDRNKDDWWVIDKENAPTINIKINK